MKEKIFNITRFIMFTVAILQLAFSQIHIAITTKIFDTTVGFYLFLYIMFGIIVAFNSVNIKRKSNIWLSVLGCIGGSLAGLKYLIIVFNDLKGNNIITFTDVRWSVYLTIIAIVSYFFGLIILIITKGKND